MAHGMTREQATKKLGVAPGATDDEIKTAYKRLAKMYHPDNNPDPVAEIVYREIAEAYNMLCRTPRESGVVKGSAPATQSYGRTPGMANPAQGNGRAVGGGSAMRGKSHTVGEQSSLRERRRQQERLDRQAQQKRRDKAAKEEQAKKELYERRKVLELRKALNSVEVQQLIAAIETSMQESRDKKNQAREEKLREAFEAYYKNQKPPEEE